MEEGEGVDDSQYRVRFPFGPDFRSKINILPLNWWVNLSDSKKYLQFLNTTI